MQGCRSGLISRSVRVSYSSVRMSFRPIDIDMSFETLEISWDVVWRGWTCQVTCSVTGLQSFTEYQAMHLNILERASKCWAECCTICQVLWPHRTTRHAWRSAQSGRKFQIPLAWTQNWLLELLELLELVSGSSQRAMYELHLRQRLGLLWQILHPHAHPSGFARGCGLKTHETVETFRNLETHLHCLCWEILWTIAKR